MAPKTGMAPMSAFAAIFETHASQYDFGNIQLNRDNENCRSRDIREGIADPGDQSHDGIQSHADGCSRDREPLVQQVGEEPDKKKAVHIGRSRP